MSKIDIEKVLEIAYETIKDEDCYYDFKKALCSVAGYKEGSKVTLKDNLGEGGSISISHTGRQMDRNDYNNMEVTLGSVYFNDDGTLDTFFIEEDDCYFEWSIEDIKN
jgi:hypothetical protein